MRNMEWKVDGLGMNNFEWYIINSNMRIGWDVR
jgi:hypothetical protein